MVFPGRSTAKNGTGDRARLWGMSLVEFLHAASMPQSARHGASSKQNTS